MRKKNYKGRCEKVSMPKCHGVCKTYDPIQMAYAIMLQEDGGVSEFWCNVVLDGEGKIIGEEYEKSISKGDYFLLPENAKEPFYKAYDAARYSDSPISSEEMDALKKDLRL